MAEQSFRDRVLGRPTTRRQVVKGALAVGAGAIAAPVLLRYTGAAQEKPPTYSGNASITSWGFGTEPTNPMAYGRVDAFRKAYPNIKISFVPNLNDQKLLTAAASHTVPDLLWFSRDAVTNWASRGVLMPLDDFVKKAEIDTSVFYPGELDAATYDGKLYGLPQFVVVDGLYVNNDQLKAIGVDGSTLDTSNWDQLSTYGGKLIQKSGSTTTRWGFDTKIQAATIWLWGVANGGSFMSADYKKATFNDPKNVDALTWGVNAYDAQGGYKVYDALSTTWQGDEQFAQGKVAMTVYESWMLGIIASVAPKLNFTLLPLKKNGQNAIYSTQTGSVWAIPVGSPNPEAAWTFIQYMNLTSTWMTGATVKKQYLHSKGGPYIPDLTGNKVADQMELSQLYESIAPHFDAAVKLWPEIIANSAATQISHSPVNNQLSDLMNAEGVLPALRKEASPKDALDKANQDAQDAIDSFQS